MITSIEPKTFFYNKNLKWLSLANNTVKTLHLIYAWNNTLLYKLDLSGNKIGLISIDMIYLNADIKCLLLNNNNITDIAPLYLDRQTQLETLILSNNQLTHLRPKLFSTHTNLLNLSLAGNYISYISRMAFYGLEQLERLDLSNNNIAVLSPVVFRHLLAYKLVQKFNVLKLKHLNLAGNKIRSFDLQEYFPLRRNCDTFGRSFELVSLDLSANRLDSLNTTSVNWLKESNTLTYLGGNPWRCECSALQGAWRELRKKLTLHCASPKHLEGQTWNVIGNMCYNTSLFAELDSAVGHIPNTSVPTPSLPTEIEVGELLMKNNATDESGNINGASPSVITALVVAGVLLVCLLVGGGFIVVHLVKKSKKRSVQTEYWDVYAPRTDVSQPEYCEPYALGTDVSVRPSSQPNSFSGYATERGYETIM
jgi:Leucine-rich repeat (LRR) protein